jgi:hypothetical protein
VAYNERFHRDLRKELEDRRTRGKEDDFWTGLKGAIDSKQISPHEFSIRGLFENFVETRANGQRVGPELVNSFNPSRGGGRTLLEEAGNAISTANFSNITGQIMYSTLLDRYKDRSFIGDKLVTTVPTEFNGEKIPGINRIGDEAESIGEGKAYPTASFSESWIQTPQRVVDPDAANNQARHDRAGDARNGLLRPHGPGARKRRRSRLLDGGQQREADSRPHPGRDQLLQLLGLGLQHVPVVVTLD